MLQKPDYQDFKDGTTFYYLRKTYFYLQEMEIQKHSNFNSFFYKLNSSILQTFFFVFI